MHSSRLALALTLTLAASFTASRSEACPIGVAGIADPGSTVCALSSLTGYLYCDVADAGGNFNIIGGAVPPSTSYGCLPTGGDFVFYEVGCEDNAMNVDRNDPSQQFGGPWLDLRCDGVSCGGGKCDHDVYCDGCVCYSPTSAISILMCQCNLLDPACGVGTCTSGGAYNEGGACPTPVSYSPSSVVSQVMCAGVSIDPDTCSTEDCRPYSLDLGAGVCDNYDPSNGAESPSPSADLLSYIASVYPVSGSRDFDEIHKDEWFGHTFTGLAPQGGAHICRATLTATLGRAQGSLTTNDSLALFFVDSSGTPVGASYSATLASFGITGGSSATISLDIGTVGGAAMLAQMENGWLDFIVQDDSAVDCLDLKVDYCCEGDPTGQGDPPSTK